MNSNYETSFLSIALDEYLSDFESAVFLNENCEILSMRYETIPDVGTFGPMVKTVARYFQPKEGDYVLLNDPYSGGTMLFTMALVTAIQFNSQKFYLATRIRFKPHAVFSKRIEDEGIRIPPTPLVINNVINHEIIEAIVANSLAPALFRERILALVEKMQRRVKQFHLSFRLRTKIFAPINQKSLITVTQKRVQEAFAELPHGDARYEEQLPSGERLRLKAELTPEKYICDFQGTSPAKAVYLTDLVTYGSCVSALTAVLGPSLPVNEGFYSCVDVSTPQGSFLSAKYPSPLNRGAIEGISNLATANLACLGQIIPQKAIGGNNYSVLTLALDFKETSYFDVVAGGTGATAKSDGIDGMHFWQRDKREMSVEMIETSYPLLILQNGIRKNSGGKGQYKGGNGIHREFEVLAACEARWFFGSLNQQPKGVRGGGSGLGPELFITRADGSKEMIEIGVSSTQLKPHDRITVMSSGGGGFGKVTASEKKT